MFTCSRPGCCYDYCSLCGRLQDAVTIVHSVAVCRMLLPSLFTLWPFAGCCYHHCSLCGRLQEAVTITVHSVAVCRMLLRSFTLAICRILLWSFTLWLFAGFQCPQALTWLLSHMTTDTFVSTTSMVYASAVCLAATDRFGHSVVFLDTYVTHRSSQIAKHVWPRQPTQQRSSPGSDFFFLFIPFFSSNSGSVKLHIL